MKIECLKLYGQYKGLKDQQFDFSNTSTNVIALIGLNGSGKSQLMELIAEIFAFLERCQRSDFQVRTTLPFGFNIIYSIKTEKDSDFLSSQYINTEIARYQLSIQPSSDYLEYSCLNSSILPSRISIKKELLPEEICLPYVIGYASGLNENLQRSFMKNAVHQYEIRRIRAKRQKELFEANQERQEKIDEGYFKQYPHIFMEQYYGLTERAILSSKLTYIDYDNTSLLLLSMAMLEKKEIKELFQDIKYKYLHKATLQYDFRTGIIENDAIRDIKRLMRIVGEKNVDPIGLQTTESQYELYELDYLAGNIVFDFTDVELISRLHEENIQQPLDLFINLNNIQQLGIKNWLYDNRKKLLKDNFVGTVKKPLKTRLPLAITELFLTDQNGTLVSFDDLSDGELQLMQILASTRIFSKQQFLCLYDEPETHLNPSWRTHFYSYLIKSLNQSDSQIFISTHSPFMISSLKRENVFFFERDNTQNIYVKPVNSQTYGASFDVLIKEFFGLRSLIPQSVIDDIREQIKSGNNAATVKWIEDHLGLSAERAYLLKELSK